MWFYYNLFTLVLGVVYNASFVMHFFKHTIMFVSNIRDIVYVLF